MNADRHIVVAGAGCAGLAVARELDARLPTSWRITVVDESFTSGSDKTWCFWGDVPSAIAPLVRHTWNNARVAGPGWERTDPLETSPYHLVEGDAYQRFHLQRLHASPRVRMVTGRVQALHDDGQGEATVVVDGSELRARWIFQSLRRPPGHRRGRVALLQHFGGWEIEAASPRFDPSTLTLMDFDVAQQGALSFRYVLPISATRALVEHTVFSAHAFAHRTYDESVREWIDEHVGPCRVVRSEYGAIPMRQDLLPQRSGSCTFNIGSVGGMTKPTTGYTFLRIQQQARSLARGLAEHGEPTPLPPAPARFAWYDGLLLDILGRSPELGHPIFSRLFQSRSVDDVLTFLDERSSRPQEAAIFARLPWSPFLASALRREPRDEASLVTAGSA